SDAICTPQPPLPQRLRQLNKRTQTPTEPLENALKAFENQGLRQYNKADQVWQRFRKAPCRPAPCGLARMPSVTRGRVLLPERSLHDSFDSKDLGPLANVRHASPMKVRLLPRSSRRLPRDLRRAV